MAFKGTLNTMPMPDILQWLADARKTGTLIVTYKNEKKEIYLKNGVIISASSNLDKDRFGVLLVKEGIVTQENLLKLLDEGRKTGKLLGKLCVEKGLLSESKTKDMLQQQAEQIIESLFHRREGEFVFKEGSLPQKDLVHISIIMHQLFFDSATKRKHWRRIHDIIGRVDTLLKTAPVPPGNIQSLTDLEKQLISISNESVSVMDICAKIEKKDFEICMALADLIEKKWLIKVEEPNQDTTDDPLEDELWHVSILLEQQRYLQAVKTLENMKHRFIENKRVLSLLDRANTLLADDIDRILKHENKKPSLVKNFDKNKLHSLNFTAQEWFVFSRINGKTSLKDLYHISGLGKRGTQRVIYALIKAGAVDLQDFASPSATGRFKLDPSQLAKKKSAPSKSTRMFSTGEFTIPENYLKSKEKTQDTEQLDIEKLNEIYSQYLNMNHYEILGISQNASQSEIREAFVRLSKQYHPDMHFENLQASTQERLEELFSMVNHAYRVLSQPSSRKRYDEELWANRKVQSLHTSNVILDVDTPSIDVKLKQKPFKKKIHIEKPEKSIPSDAETIPSKSDEYVSSPEKRDKPSSETPSGKSQKKDWTYYLQEGKTFLENKKFKKSVDSLEKSIRMNPKNAEIYYFLSKAQENAGGPLLKKAEENIKRALILDKENPDYYYQLAKILMARENLIEAERYAKTALAWNSRHKKAKKLLEQIQEKQKGTSIFKALKLGRRKKKK